MIGESNTSQDIPMLQYVDFIEEDEISPSELALSLRNEDDFKECFERFVV